MRRSAWWIVVIICSLSVVAQRTNAQSKVLMFVDPAAAWHPDSELELVDFLESSGYSVTVQPVAEVVGEDQILASEGYDVVYMADSIGSTTVHDGADIFLKDIEIPIISQEAYMWDEAEWTGRLQFEDFGDTFQAIDDQALGAFTTLDIVNPDHPMAAGLSGTVQVYEDPYGYNFGLIEQMGPGVDVIATIPGAPDYATLFVYEKGSELAEGTITAGMRIGMFIGQNVAREEFGGDGTNNRWDRLTPDGMALVKAAFDYATGKIVGGVVGDFDGNGVLDAADIDDLTNKSASGTHPGDYDLTNDALVNSDGRRSFGSLTCSTVGLAMPIWMVSLTRVTWWRCWDRARTRRRKLPFGRQATSMETDRPTAATSWPPWPAVDTKWVHGRLSRQFPNREA